FSGSHSTVMTPASVTLNSAGVIDQAAGVGAISAGTLTGRSAGGATLNAANVISNLGPWDNTGSGDVALNNAHSLTVNGAIDTGFGDTGNVTLTTTGALSDLTINADIATTAGQTVTLNS